MISPCKTCLYRHKDKNECIDAGCDKPFKMVQQLHREAYRHTGRELVAMPVMQIGQME